MLEDDDGFSRWKKFHFLADLSGLFALFSNFLGLYPPRVLVFVVFKLEILESTLPRLGLAAVNPPIFSGRGRWIALVEELRRCIERRKASEDLAVNSSELSLGRLLPIETRFGFSLGRAEGQSVVLLTSLTDDFESMLGRSPECLLPLSRISPPPAMMTGLILSSKNGS